MTSRPSTAAPILAALAVVLVLLGIYAVAYLALVRKTDEWGKFIVINRKPMYAPEYRIGGDIADTLFTPAYRVDTTLRPSYWGRRPADPYDVEVFP